MSEENINIKTSDTKRPGRDRPPVSKGAKALRFNQLRGEIISILSLAAVVAMGVFCYLTVESISGETKTVVIDGAGNFHVGYSDFVSLDSPIFSQTAIIATQAALQVSKVGLNLDELAQEIFTKKAYERLVAQVESEKPELDAKNLHIKPEISLIEALAEKEGQRIIQVSGNLVVAGSYEDMPIAETIPFKCVYAIGPNPDLSEIRRFPYVINDFRINKGEQTRR